MITYLKITLGIISISIALIMLYAIGKVTRPLIDPSADDEDWYSDGTGNIVYISE